MTDLYTMTRDLARAYKAAANKLDAEYASWQDPRAIEGGARDEQAQAYRKAARQLLTLAEEANIEEGSEAPGFDADHSSHLA